SSGESPTRMGNRHPNIAPYEALPVSDGWLILAVGNDRQFRRFCELVGLDDMPEDERFSSNSARIENREELTTQITQATKQWQRDELLTALEETGVPAGPINTVEQAFADPQTRFRAMQQLMKRAADGISVPGVRTPIRFSDAELDLSTPSPILGGDKAKWR
ncbi:MAG: CoA transferase, partial [Gammaproteobacteria bacterium]